MKEKNLEFIQDQIGYHFKNTDLLIQAFTRKSYVVENGGVDNEVLEFIGDKALDFAIIKLFAERFGNMVDASYCVRADGIPLRDMRLAGQKAAPSTGPFLSSYGENSLTEMKKQLVKKETLADCIDILGIAQYLILGNGDTKNNIQNSMSVKEDLFEAILGAVALDCQWDMNTIQDCVEVMLNPDEWLETNSINYVAEIQEWSLNRADCIPYHRFDTASWYSAFLFQRHPACIYGTVPEDTKYYCELQIPDVEQHFIGYGRSKSIARKMACELAYNYLDNANMLHSIRDEIDEPSLEMAINQLEILSRRGYFSLPSYTFEEAHDPDGNPVWYCECSIEEEDDCFWAESSSKKAAKKEAAYGMLLHMLGIKEEE